MTRPTAAEQARTSLARSRLGLLTTYPRGAAPAQTTVSVSDDGGAALVRIGRTAQAVLDLLAHPIATLRVAPSWCETLTVRGPVRRLPGVQGAGVLQFRLEVATARLGSEHSDVVCMADYHSATPDPLRDDAPAILDHLSQGHGAQLAACLRRHGHDGARWAEPRRLDKFGLELDVLDDDGVSRVRLDFPEVASRFSDLEPGLAILLRPGRCSHCTNDHG